MCLPLSKKNFSNLMFLAVGVVAFALSSGMALADAKLDLIERLYIDLTSRRPDEPKILALKAKLAIADNPAELRQVVSDEVNSIINTYPLEFENRVINYFNGVFGMSLADGYVLPLCTGASTSTCVTDEEALDFRNQLAAHMARFISGRGFASGTKVDIRGAVLSRFTVITPAIADKFINNATLREAVGMSAVPMSDLTAIKAKASNLTTDPVAHDYFLIDRTDSGIPTATADHQERHAGILTVPSFFLRSKIHLSRAFYALKWMMCGNVSQSDELEQPSVIKLAERSPCRGCHATLEPLGSFFVHWRPRIDTATSVPKFFLDTPGSVPIDEANSVHSRNLDGSFQGQSGRGVRALAEIIAAKPEFAQCMATHAWQMILRRPLDATETGWARVLGTKLVSEYSWDLRQVIVDIILSKAYADEVGNESK